jgi:hypothetical protein
MLNSFEVYHGMDWSHSGFYSKAVSIEKFRILISVVKLKRQDTSSRAEK